MLSLKKDIDCFLNTYTNKNNKNNVSEDNFLSPFSELNLIKESFNTVPVSIYGAFNTYGEVWFLNVKINQNIVKIFFFS